MASIDFYFDVVCPYAYLAHTQIEQLAADAGAQLHFKPILLGGLFRTIGAGDGPTASMPAAKAKLNLLDMQRWAAHWNVPLEMPATHPNRSVMAMRCVLAAPDSMAAAKALFRTYWQEAQDISQPEVVAAALQAAGFDGTALVEAAGTQPLKDELRRRTDEAAAAGAFGVPTFVVRAEGHEPEMFWGQDRMHFVAAALAERKSA